MKTFIGVKAVRAEPEFRPRDPAKGRLAGEDGYKVVYPDGYTSWSPKAVFEEAYVEVPEGEVSLLLGNIRAYLNYEAHGIYPTGLDFGAALRLLKQGKRLARAGWNGKGMWIAYSPGSPQLPPERFWSPQNRRHAEEHGPTDVLPCLTMKTATGEILMGWLASQTDMLAEDWEVLG